MPRKPLLTLLLCISGTAVGLASGDWHQWGGPGRDFKTQEQSLANSWPQGGPRKLWSRSLGEGYSSIVVDGTTLYTMYRKSGIFSYGDEEIAVALDAASGKTLWEHSYPAVPDKADMNMEYGMGPHATPLVFGDRLFTIGILGKLLCLDRRTGKVLWAHDLVQEYGGSTLHRGYSASPLIYKGTLIVPVGGTGHGVMAFDPGNGNVVWKNLDMKASHASPIIINVDGQDQLVLFTPNSVVGADPVNGNQLWSHRHETQWGLNISTPVWGADNLLFCSSAYTGGSRMLKLSQKDGTTTVQSLWFTPKMRVHHGNAIRIGDTVYGSSGDFGPAFLIAVNARNGEVLWQDRGLPKASFVYADGKFIVLDEDGGLALATFTPEGVKILSRMELMDGRSWTAPTLVGGKLYVRDRKTIVALDLR